MARNDVTKMQWSNHDTYIQYEKNSGKRQSRITKSIIGIKVYF
jgi:hypothetical protein